METLETTTNIFAAECGEILDLSSSKKTISTDTYSDDMDGCFPRIGDWTRFANRIDNEGIPAFLTYIGKRNKLKIDCGFYTIERESQYDDNAIIKFKEPIDVLIATVGDENIIRKVSSLEGEFTYDWYYSSIGRQHKIANTLEVYFKVDKINK